MRGGGRGDEKTERGDRPRYTTLTTTHSCFATSALPTPSHQIMDMVCNMDARIQSSPRTSRSEGGEKTSKHCWMCRQLLDLGANSHIVHPNRRTHHILGYSGSSVGSFGDVHAQLTFCSAALSVVCRGVSLEDEHAMSHIRYVRSRGLSCHYPCVLCCVGD